MTTEPAEERLVLPQRPGNLEAGDGQPDPLHHHLGVAVVLDRHLDPLQDHVSAQLHDLGPERRLAAAGVAPAVASSSHPARPAERDQADGEVSTARADSGRSAGGTIRP